MQKLGWGWPAAAFGVVCALSATALVLLVLPQATHLAGTAAATSVAVHLFVLVAASFIYLHWRMSGSPQAGWLTLTLVMLSTPHLALAGVLIADPAAADRGPWWPLVTKVLVVAAILLVAVLASRLEALPRVPLPVDPMAAGLGTGLCFSALGLALVSWAPDLVVPSPVITGLALVPVLLALVTVRLAVRGAQLTRGGQFRVSLGVVLVSLGQVAEHSTLPLAVGRGVNVVASVVGAALLCHFALAMIRASFRQNRREVASLYHRLGAIESTVRENRARLHEVASTVAGITSVSRLIHQPTVVLPFQRRSLLEHTMDSELSRLGRLTMRESSASLAFDLDDILRRLVIAQHAQGRRVDWQPSGVTVFGRQDDLTEVLHVLLDNAGKHAGDAGAWVDVRGCNGMAEIRVSDHGPGIPPELRSRLFEWGARGSDSRGQGIGLAIARELMEQQDGYLVLDNSPPTGTTFVVGVLVGEKRDATSNRAG